MLDPLGLYFGSLLASKIDETNPSSRLKTALEGSPLLFQVPRGLQEPPGAFQEASKNAPAAQDAPRWLPDGSKIAPGPILEPFGDHLGAILGRIL